MSGDAARTTWAGEPALGRRLARSARAVGGEAVPDGQFRSWLDGRRRAHHQQVRPVPLDGLSGWLSDPSTGDLRHRSGRFYSVHGLRVETSGGPLPQWWQPIINQPEIGILGIAVREIGGLLHLLVQAKSEPGNINGVQLSPTVQATRSNYTRVHGGSAVRYLECFRDVPEAAVLADVLHSEQGSWFLRKRNRNMVVEVGPQVEADEDFCWLTLRQLHDLLGEDDLVNMDTRSVLSCLPVPTADVDDDRARFACQPADGRHSDVAVRSWIADRRSEHQLTATRVPLGELERHGWTRDADRISHREGGYFEIIGVDVSSGRREVAAWQQPLLHPVDLGRAAFLLKRIDGVPHALVQAHVQPGCLDVLELGPTVQCEPDRHLALLPSDRRPRFLDLVVSAPAARIRFDAVLSEEGGRLHHARNRYQLIEVGDEVPDHEPPDHRWLSLAQLTGLLRYSHYLNVEARTLVAAWRTLAAAGAGRADRR